MATYKEIRGTTVQNNAGNLPSAVDGQLWYDSTNAAFKHQYPNLTTAGAWRTGNNMNTARAALEASSQSGTAALVFAGTNPGTPPGGVQAVTESYDGTSWTEVADLNTGRQAGVGSGASNTSALMTLGETDTVNTGATESWNGTSWTEVADANTARRLLAGGGTQ